MLSSKGTEPAPSWRTSLSRVVTGFVADAPRAAAPSAPSNRSRSSEATRSIRGWRCTSSGSCPRRPRDGARHRLEGAVRRDLHEDVAGIVHERAHLALVAPAHLIAAALGEIAHAEQNGALAVPLHRGADDLDQAPPRCGVDPDLDRCADVAAVDGGQRAQHELLVVRVHQVQARPADGVADRPLEHALGRGVPPDDVPVRVDHDDRIGQAQEGFDDGIGLVDGPARLGRGLELTRDRVQRVPTFSSLPGARPYQL